MAAITYIVPIKAGSEDFFIGLLKNFISSINYLPDSEILIVSESIESEAVNHESIKVVKVPQSLQMWEKVAHIAPDKIRTDLVGFITCDDFWLYNPQDLKEFKRQKAMVGSGNHAMAYPYKNQSFFLWQGWNQNKHYMGDTPTLPRFRKFISEGPVCHHAVYRTDYYVFVLELIKKLVKVLANVPSGVSLIEDCLNLTALCSTNYYFPNSWCLRFMDNNYSQISGWKSSNQVMKSLNKEQYDEIVEAIFTHLHESNNCISEKCLILNREQINVGLQLHSVGYSGAMSRKWRAGIDLLFFPFLDQEVKQVTVMPGTLNKYNPTFLASHATLDDCVFPDESILGSRHGRQLIKICPKQMWEIHLAKESI